MFHLPQKNLIAITFLAWKKKQITSIYSQLRDLEDMRNVFEDFTDFIGALGIRVLWNSTKKKKRKKESCKIEIKRKEVRTSAEKGDRIDKSTANARILNSQNAREIGDRLG